MGSLKEHIFMNRGLKNLVLNIRKTLKDNKNKLVVRKEITKFLNEYDSLDHRCVHHNKYINWNDCYTRNLVHKEDDFEVTVLCWRANTKVPVHSHPKSQCFYRVLQGSLSETRFQNRNNQNAEEKSW